MAGKTLDSKSKIDDLIQFAKECDLSRFNKTELALRQSSLILNRLDDDTLYVYGNSIMGSMFVPDIHKNYTDVIVPNAETTLRNLFAGAEGLATRKRVYDGVEDVDALKILKSTKSRQVAEAGARCSVILAEFRKLDKIVKAFEERKEKGKERDRSQRMYAGVGKQNSDGSYRLMDGYEVSGGVITELGISVPGYLAICREKKSAAREARNQREAEALKAKQAASAA